MRLLQSPKAVLIDLDGTLVDSVPDLAYGIDEMMAQLAMPVRGIAAVTEWVGNGVERLVKRALLNSMDGEPDEALYQRALPIFEIAYAANNGRHSYLYDGVVQGLDYLRQQGYRLGCVTNKPAAFTAPLLVAMDIADYFEVTVSGDEVDRRKPDPQPLLMAAQQLQVEPQLTLMLGDSVSDVAAARAAGMPVICVSYGYNHGQDIRSHDPDAVITSLAELKTLI
ncbi:MAG: phosphoglycolate phosphatase [Gammaproteobacteria bacterium]